MTGSYARRRALSLGIVAAAAVAFGALTWLRVQAVRHPYASFAMVSPQQARAELRGCAYREEQADAAGFVDAIIDGLDRMPSADRLTLEADRVAITGWAVFARPLRPVDGVVAVVDGRCAAAAKLRESRPDVAAALKDPLAADSGFTLILDPPELPKGAHRVTVYAIDARHRLRARLGKPSSVTIR